MKPAFERFVSYFPTGIRVLLCLFLLVYLVSLFGLLSHAYDLSAWLALNPADFWKGSLWQIASYAFLSSGFLHLMTNAVLLSLLGSRLEKNWSGRELWSFCLLTAVGAGFTKVLLAPLSANPMAGPSGIIYGFLAAWMRLFGSEPILLMGFWPMTVRWMILLIAAVGLVMTGWMQPNNRWDLLAALGGGITGWVYLSGRWKKNFAKKGRSVSSERIGKLEV